MKLISVMIPCYNEEANIRETYSRITSVFHSLPQYEYELIIPDNASTDNTQKILREIASSDRHVKVILNTRNFGADRSCTNAFLQCMGDAVIQIAADLQDPPEMIKTFIQYWEDGYKIVLGQKRSTKDSFLIGLCRKAYYAIVCHLTDNVHLRNVTGFGLYDKKVMDILRWMEDPQPYTRGIIADIGMDIKLVAYDKAERKGGKSSYNFWSYVECAIWGIANSTKKPLFYLFYLAVFLMLVSGVVFVLSIIGNVFKDNLGWIISCMLAMSSFIIFSIGIVGEYIGLVLTKLEKRPLAVAKEKINFDDNIENGILEERKIYGQ